MGVVRNRVVVTQAEDGVPPEIQPPPSEAGSEDNEQVEVNLRRQRARNRSVIMLANNNICAINIEVT